MNGPSIPRRAAALTGMTLDQLCAAKQIAHDRAVAAAPGSRSLVLALNLRDKIDREAARRGYRLHRTAQGRPYVADRLGS